MLVNKSLALLIFIYRLLRVDFSLCCTRCYCSKYLLICSIENVRLITILIEKCSVLDNKAMKLILYSILKCSCVENKNKIKIK